MAKEYRRTCERCETDWYVTAKERKERAPSNLQVGLKGRSGLTAFKTKKKQMLQMQMKEQQERVSSREHCPSCGSTKFREVDPDKQPTQHLTRRAITSAAGLATAGAKHAAEKVKESRAAKKDELPPTAPCAFVVADSR